MASAGAPRLRWDWHPVAIATIYRGASLATAVLDDVSLDVLNRNLSTPQLPKPYTVQKAWHGVSETVRNLHSEPGRIPPRPARCPFIREYPLNPLNRSRTPKDDSR